MMSVTLQQHSTSWALRAVHDR